MRTRGGKDTGEVSCGVCRELVAIINGDWFPCSNRPPEIFICNECQAEHNDKEALKGWFTKQKKEGE